MKFKILYLILSFAIVFSACKKDAPITSLDVSSIFVFNAVTDAAAIKVNTSGKPVSWKAITDLIGYGTNKFYYGPIGTIPFIAVSAVDTTKVLFNKNVNLQNKKFYSMYIFGTAANVDTMFREESNYPVIQLRTSAYAPADSVTNVRFINLSYGSPALNINIQGNPVNEVTNLTYKGITPFKGYPSKLVTGTTSYTFEIRNAATNVLITSYMFRATATNQFKNVALVIRGIFGTTTGIASFGVSELNYF